MAEKRNKPELKRVEKLNPVQSSIFQNMALNLVILVAFLIVVLICVNSMESMVDSAVSASTNQAHAIEKVNRTKENFRSVNMNLDMLVALASMPEYVSTYVSNMEGAVKEIDTLKAELNDSILVTQIGDGQAHVDALTTALDTYTANALAAADEVQNGNVEKAVAYVTGDAQTDAQAVEAAFETIQGELDSLIDGMGTYLNIKKNAAVHKTIIGIVIVVLIISLSLAMSVMRISTKTTAIADEIQAIIADINSGRGDLTKRIQTPVTTELIFIKNGMNDFLDTMQGIIKDVKDGAVVLNTSSEEMTEQIRRASDNVTNSSAALEELSASMDNVATTATGISEHLDEVKEAVNDITTAAAEGSQTAEEIKVEANAIKQEAGQKKSHTGARMQEMSGVLEQSVKDSEKVKQINDLTNEILSIASQTNLLALNASIEAARAGEAGRGFAVVADEISQLADNSRETASNIQQISDEVTQAVSVLAKNAQEVLEFINTTVITDYDAFVETGEKYENTSTVIDGMLGRFTEKAEHLDEIMKAMAQAISSITESIEQSSSAISMSANNSTEIVEEISGIDMAMGRNNEVTAQLSSSTQKFEVV